MKDLVVFTTRLEKEDLKKLRVLAAMSEKSITQIINELVKAEVKRLKMEHINE